ncbi:protein of unknown function DUF2040 [Trinorchestia longiramus]|nr:protein of unknown function DUF2040 [Trinorchestia longiramus]
MASNKKKYGLILASARRQEELRSAAGGGGVRKINILRTSDDELEEDDPHQEEESQLSSGKKRGEGNSAQQAQQLRLMREALEEDPSIFMYDEHYDDLKAKQTAVETKKQQNSEPKYIERILKSAQRRQLERERCTVRKLQKEREAEEGFFDDKESFVTPAYVKKLEEIRQAEAREKMMEIIEEKNDAMRDRSTGMFYKEIFNQRLGGDVTSIGAEPLDGAAAGKSSSNTDDHQQHYQDAGQEHEVQLSGMKRSRSPSPESKRIKRKPKDRQPDREDAEKSSSYRNISHRDAVTSDSCSKRSSGDSHRSKRDSKTSDLEFIKSNDDEEKSSRSDSEPKRSKHITKDHYNGRNSDKHEKSTQKSPSSKPNYSDKRDAKSSARRDRVSVKKEMPSSPESATECSPRSEDAKKVAETKEERVARLFTKRTVGTTFIEAQQRYLQRKADRNSTRGGL